MKSRTFIIAAVLVVAGIALLGYSILNRTHSGAARTLNLTEYGVALELPGTLSDLTYAPHDETANGPGIVLHMNTGTGCDLGAIYEIQKNAIDKSKTTWTKETLEKFTMEQGNTPAQVKEFTDFYLVFEPNPDRCATDEKEKVRELAKQRELWFALVTAHYM